MNTTPPNLSMNYGRCQALACMSGLQSFHDHPPSLGLGSLEQRVLASTPFPRQAPEPTPPHLLIASRPQNWPGCGTRPGPDLGPRAPVVPCLSCMCSPVRVGSPGPGAAPCSSASLAERTELCNAAEPTFISRGQFAGLELHCADALRYGWLLSQRP